MYNLLTRPKDLLIIQLVSPSIYKSYHFYLPGCPPSNFGGGLESWTNSRWKNGGKSQLPQSFFCRTRICITTFKKGSSSKIHGKKKQNIRMFTGEILFGILGLLHLGGWWVQGSSGPDDSRFWPKWSSGSRFTLWILEDFDLGSEKSSYKK